MLSFICSGRSWIKLKFAGLCRIDGARQLIATSQVLIAIGNMTANTWFLSSQWGNGHASGCTNTNTI